MRRLFTLLMVLVLSIWLGVTLARHPGSVLISYGAYVVEMPLWAAAIGLLIIFQVFHSGLGIWNYLRNLDTRLSEWLAHRRRNKSYDKTHRGMLTMMEGQWATAERHLMDGIHQSKNPLLNYLAAAEAAHAQKAYDRSDVYLRKAHQVAPQDEVVIGMVQAKLQMEQGQLEQVMATLNHLRQLSPYHPGVLKLIEKMYIRLAEWQNLLDLLPALRKAKVLTSNQAQQFEKNIYCQMLDDAQRKNKSIHAVRELWRLIPKKVRLQPEVLERYGNLLKDDKTSAEEIEPLIRKSLHREWNDNLAKVYASLLTSDPMRQLSMAESWAKQYGKRSSLLLILGRLSLRCQMWGKARDYLEEGLKQQPDTETQLELAKLLEHLGETKLAMHHYKHGLELAAS